MDPEKQREAELCREFKGVPGVTRGMIALHRHVNEYAASMKAGA